jgi:hypothetical protein
VLFCCDTSTLGVESILSLVPGAELLFVFTGSRALDGAFGDLVASGFLSEAALTVGLEGAFPDAIVPVLPGSFDAALVEDFGLEAEVGVLTEVVVVVVVLGPSLETRDGDFLESIVFTAAVVGGAFPSAAGPPLEVLGEFVILLVERDGPETPRVLPLEAPRVAALLAPTAPARAVPGGDLVLDTEAAARVVALDAGFVVAAGDREEGMEDSDLEAREDFGLDMAKREVVVVVLEEAGLADGRVDAVLVVLEALLKDDMVVAGAFGFLICLGGDREAAPPLQAAFSTEEVCALSVEVPNSSDAVFFAVVSSIPVVDTATVDL